MVHSGVIYISGRRRAPKGRGARGSLPPTKPSRRAWIDRHRSHDTLSCRRNFTDVPCTSICDVARTPKVCG